MKHTYKSLPLILLAAFVLLAGLLPASCRGENRQRRPRRIRVREVWIGGDWKDYLKLVPGRYALEDAGSGAVNPRITPRLRLIKPYDSGTDDLSYTFRLVPLNKAGAPLGGSAEFQISTKEKFNEFVRGKAGDTVAITFEASLDQNPGDTKPFATLAGFEGKTVDLPAPKPPEGNNAAVSGPQNTDTDPVFNARTEARTGRRIVAVPEFTATQSVSGDFIISYTAAATTGLTQNASIHSVVDYNQINLIMRQHKFEASDWSNPAKYAEIGKALNVDTIAVGTISLGGKVLFTQNAVVSVQLIDISTMAVVGSFTESQTMNNLISSTESAARRMKVGQ